MGDGPAMTVKLGGLLVDPSRFSCRETWLDQGQHDGLVHDLVAGRKLPPLRAAVPADKSAQWFACSGRWQGPQRAKWANETRRIAEWACRPIQPEAVLYDGFRRYAALLEAGVKEVEVQLDAEPVSGPADVLARAAEANLRNAARLTDGDLLSTFCRLWLGRPLKDKHESWAPTKDGLALDAIAARLDRSMAWVADMINWAQVTQEVGLNLGISKARCLGRLAGAEQRPFVWRTEAGQPVLRAHPLYDADGALLAMEPWRTVVEMTVRQLDWVIDARLSGAAEPPPPTESVNTAAGEPTEEPEGGYQLTLPFTFEWTETVRQVQEVYPVVKRLDPRTALEEAHRMAPALSAQQRLYDALVAQARRGGLEV